MGCAGSRRSRRRGWTAATIAAVIIGTTMTVTSAGAAEPPAAGRPDAVVPAPELTDSPSGADCRGYLFPVRQREGDPIVQQVFGELCSRGEVTARTPVQVLIHGGSYHHAYWDWPYQPEKYSYVEAATRAGFVTLNIDRLGYGLSDHPDPLTLDFRVAGYVTHQVVEHLRAGAVGPEFKTVVLNGHSMGGLTAQHAASTYRSVDAVIVTGVGHNFAATGVAQVADKFYPAELDPKFAGKLPPGYLTTVPGNRTATFVEPGEYDPAIGPVEERLKDTLSPTELTGITADSYDPTITRGIEVPVLYSLGQFDLIWCPTTKDCNTDPQARDEERFYAPEAEYTQYIVQTSGHSINVTTAAPDFYRETFRWLAGHGIGG